MPVCNNCFDPDCARSLLSTDACNCVDIPSVVRDPSTGVRYGEVISALPSGLSSITPSLIDGLRSYQAQSLTLPPLSAGAITLYNGGAAQADGSTWYAAVDGSNGTPVSYLVELFKHYPDEREGINQHLESLSFIAAQVSQRDLAARAVAVTIC